MSRIGKEHVSITGEVGKLSGLTNLTPPGYAITLIRFVCQVPTALPLVAHPLLTGWTEWLTAEPLDPASQLANFSWRRR